MKYDEFKIKRNDPSWALCFSDFYKSVSVSLGQWGMPLFRVIQFGLGLGLIGVLVFHSISNGYGNLIGILPIVYAVFVGRISLNLFDVIFLFIIGFVFSSLASGLQASETHYVGILFGVCYMGIGGLKFKFMNLMEDAAYKNEGKFDLLNKNNNLSWWRTS